MCRREWTARQRRARVAFTRLRSAILRLYRLAVLHCLADCSSSLLSFSSAVRCKRGAPLSNLLVPTPNATSKSRGLASAGQYRESNLHHRYSDGDGRAEPKLRGEHLSGICLSAGISVCLYVLNFQLISGLVISNPEGNERTPQYTRTCLSSWQLLPSGGS